MSAPTTFSSSGCRPTRCASAIAAAPIPAATIAASPALAGAIAALSSGAFSPDEPGRYAPIVDALYHHDRFMVTADFDAYYATQRRVDALWRDQPAWWAASIRNTANMAGSPPTAPSANMPSDIWNVPVEPPSGLKCDRRRFDRRFRR